MLRLSKLESKVDTIIINGSASNLTNGTVAPVPSGANGEKVNVAGMLRPPTPTPYLTFYFFPFPAVPFHFFYVSLYTFSSLSFFFFFFLCPPPFRFLAHSFSFFSPVLNFFSFLTFSSPPHPSFLSMFFSPSTQRKRLKLQAKNDFSFVLIIELFSPVWNAVLILNLLWRKASLTCSQRAGGFPMTSERIISYKLMCLRLRLRRR